MALDALRGDKTFQEIASHHKVHLNQAGNWKRQAMDSLDAIFSNGADKTRVDHEGEIHDIHAKISQLTVERDFLARRAQAMSREERKVTIWRIDELFPKYPFYGSCQMARRLWREGVRVGCPPGAPFDAPHEPGGYLSGTENQLTATDATNLSLSSQEARDLCAA